MMSRSLLALALLSLSLATAAGADDATTTYVNKVNLEVRVSGLGKEGCEIEIKPAHPGCKFKAVTKKVVVPRAADVLKLGTIAIVAESTSADHDCVFAITIKEPGRPPKTSRRGVRLSPRAEGAEMPVQNLPCYLTAASKPASTKAVPAPAATASGRPKAGAAARK